MKSQENAHNFKKKIFIGNTYTDTNFKGKNIRQEKWTKISA